MSLFLWHMLESYCETSNFQKCLKNSRWAWHEKAKHHHLGQIPKEMYVAHTKAGEKGREREKDGKESRLFYFFLRSYIPWTRKAASSWTATWTTLVFASQCCWEPGWCQGNAREASLLFWGTSRSCRAWHRQHNTPSKTFPKCATAAGAAREPQLPPHLTHPSKPRFHPGGWACLLFIELPFLSACETVPSFVPIPQSMQEHTDSLRTRLSSQLTKSNIPAITLWQF